MVMKKNLIFPLPTGERTKVRGFQTKSSPSPLPKGEGNEHYLQKIY